MDLLDLELLRRSGRLAIYHDFRTVFARRPAIGILERDVGGLGTGGVERRALLTGNLAILERQLGVDGGVGRLS